MSVGNFCTHIHSEIWVVPKQKQKQSSTVLHSFISERSVFAIQSGFQLPSSSAQSLDQYCCRFQALCHAHDVEEGMSQDVEPYYHTI